MMKYVSKEESSPASTASRVIFQQEGCPYSISEQEAADLFIRTSEPGNVISVEKFGVGNDYSVLYQTRGVCLRATEISRSILSGIKERPTLSSAHKEFLAVTTAVVCFPFHLQGELEIALRVCRRCWRWDTVADLEW